jgi:putative ABC transport system substrate-binding protein
MNNRRKLLIAFGAGVCAASPGSLAQRQQKVHRIGILVSDSLETRGPLIEVFMRAMRDLGYVEGRNIVYETRYAGGDAARLSAMATELAGQGLDMIVVPNDFSVQFAARAVEQAKRPVPIVFSGSSAPVAAGTGASFARPGGNVTGVTNVTHELAGKQLQLLSDAVPKISRVAVFLDFGNARLAPLYLAEVERATKAAGMQMLRLEVKSVDDVERVGEFP